MRIYTWFIGLLGAVIRALMTDRSRVGALAKCVRGALMTPVFGVLLILLRVRALLLGSLRVQTITSDGTRFACDLPDLIQMYVWLFGVWEPDLAAFVRSRLNEGDVFIDVGANIGFDSMLASHRVGDSGAVVAIEASPGVFAHLLATLRLNGSPANVHALNKAVAAEHGTLEVFAGPAHNVGLTTTVQRGEMPRIASIAAAPLGELVEPAHLCGARLIKIDVEGGEDAVLAGMLASLDSLAQEVEIAVELSPLWWRDRSKTARDVLTPFIQRGFRVYTIPNNYWPWRYLWPNDVQRPRRLRDDRLLTRPMKRLDVILSRSDSDEL